MPRRFEDMTAEELKERLAKKDLPVSGTKDEMIARLRGDKVEAAKEGADEGAPPAKRSTKLDRFAELADDDWVRGNPEQAAALEKAAAEMGPVPKTAKEATEQAKADSNA